MTELLVQPYRDFDEQRVDEIFCLPAHFSQTTRNGLLRTWRSQTLPPLSGLSITLRTRMPCKPRPPHTPGRLVLITNDSVFERLDAFETLVLDQLLNIITNGRCKR